MQTEKDSKKNALLLPLKVGEIVEGKTIKLSKSALFLDLGAKGTGIIYGQEFTQAKDMLRDVKIGDNIWAKVIELDNEDGYIELSLTEAQQELLWKELEEKKEKEENLKVKILGANKGGLLSKIFDVAAFLPVSQLSNNHYPKVEGGDKTKILRELQKLIGQELEVKIINLDQKQGKLILSEKVRGEKEIEEALKNYKVGDVVEGKITALTDFGAFIVFPSRSASATTSQMLAGAGGSQDNNVAPIAGLIHISELDWQLVKDPSKVVKLGQITKVKIIEISNNKVALSLKALNPQK